MSFRLSEVLPFLDRSLAASGLAAATAFQRRSVCERVFEFATAAEREDVRGIDPEQLVQRFVKQNRRDIGPSTLSSYVSHVRVVLDEFVRDRRKANGENRGGSTVDNLRSGGLSGKPDALNLEFPVAGVTVRVSGIPTKLNRPDAELLKRMLIGLLDSVTVDR